MTHPASESIQHSRRESYFQRNAPEMDVCYGVLPTLTPGNVFFTFVNVSPSASMENSFPKSLTSIGTGYGHLEVFLRDIT